MKKDALGLPHYDRGHRAPAPRRHVLARSRRALQRAARPFKIACRDQRGVMVTIIADNYYGYCKKEVKTQISFAANLFGLCEEEHAGGAIAFATYVLGQDFYADRTVSLKKATFADAMHLLEPLRRAPSRRLRHRPPLPRNLLRARESPNSSCAKGSSAGSTTARRISSPSARAATYVLPSGFRIRLEKQPGGNAWRLVGVAPERHAVPQALHRLRRRQIRNLEIASRTRMLEGPGLRRRLPARYGSGRRNPREGFFRRL